MSDLIARLDFAASSVLVGHPAVARALDDAVAALRQKEEQIAGLQQAYDELADRHDDAERELAELREPTEAMITAGYQAIGAKLYPATCKALWIAMYDKRPKAERGMG